VFGWNNEHAIFNGDSITEIYILQTFSQTVKRNLLLSDFMEAKNTVGEYWIVKQRPIIALWNNSITFAATNLNLQNNLNCSIRENVTCVNLLV